MIPTFEVELEDRVLVAALGAEPEGASPSQRYTDG